MKALERHRKNWVGKSDEWIFERIDLELKDKVNTIHELLERVNFLEGKMCDCQDYEKGLVSNSCLIHNEHPISLDKDWQ